MEKESVCGHAQQNVRSVCLSRTAIGFCLAVYLLLPALTKSQTPFLCNNSAYQVAGPVGGASTLYSYNVNTGSRTTIAALGFKANAIGYNPADNMIWGYNQATNRVVTIDATGASVAYDIPNLPNNEYNVGSVLSNGYLFLYYTSTPRYFIVDINPARPTYLNIVDPVAGFTLDASPYGTALSTALNVNDFAFSATTGMLYSIVNPGATNQFRIATLNPTTGDVTFSAIQVSGAGIQAEGDGYGSVFTDVNTNTLYVFANNQGRFYEVDLSTNIATLLSTSIPATNNDGASCPSANLNLNILPVRLTSFEAKVNSCNVQLYWKTASEENFSFFQVQQSPDGINYTNQAKVNSHGSINGGSYNYAGSLPGSNVYYRLQMVDKDGAIAYSPVVVATSRCTNRSIQVMPNPVQSVLSIRGVEPGETVSLFSVSGQLIYQQKAALTFEQIGMSDKPVGVYQLVIRDKNGTIIGEQRIVKGL